MLIEITNPSTKEIWNYYMDGRLTKYLDKLKIAVNKKDKDLVLLIDGYEGAGKSTFAQHIGRYLDPSLSLEKICMTADEFKQAIIDAQKGECVIYDEAVTGLTSSDSISRIGKLLKSMMMQMRQKNLFVIVILPVVFELNKYAVLSRAKGLFHIYEKNGKRGFFVGYNRKDLRKMYNKGKKTHTYCVRSFFMGRFVGKYVVDEELYRKKKGEALFRLDDEETINERYPEHNLIANLYACAKRIDSKITQEKFTEWLGKFYRKYSRSNISRIVGTAMEKGAICEL